MSTKLLSLFGLKFHPFRPEIPDEALYRTPAVDSFCARVELTVGDGGFVLTTGEPGSGKSVALRLLAQRLRGLRDVVVGTIDHPQSRISDFYRELGDIFGVPFPSHNRWAGFKTLRTRWGEHISKTMMRPVLIVDEAQEMLSSVFGELRVRGDQVELFTEKPQTSGGVISGGFFVFSRHFLDRLSAADDCDLERGPLERLAQDGQLMVYEHRGDWACVDTYRDLQHANQLWSKGQAFWRIWS